MIKDYSFSRTNKEIYDKVEVSYYDPGTKKLIREVLTEEQLEKRKEEEKPKKEKSTASKREQKKEDKKKEKMEKKLKITKKDLITLILSKNNKTKPDLGLSLFNVMDKYKDSFNTCEIFLVERQMIVNRQALKLSHYLEAWLKINYPDKKVINYSASQKTKLLGAKNLKTKKDRKLWTVEYTLNLLQGETLEQFKQFRKQDDLADVVCMIESYLRKKK